MLLRFCLSKRQEVVDAILALLQRSPPDSGALRDLDVANYNGRTPLLESMTSAMTTDDPGVFKLRLAVIGALVDAGADVRPALAALHDGRRGALWDVRRAAMVRRLLEGARRLAIVALLCGVARCRRSSCSSVGPLAAALVRMPARALRLVVELM